jgi:hypothetical protein
MPASAHTSRSIVNDPLPLMAGLAVVAGFLVWRASRSGSARGCRLESGDLSRHGLTLRNRREESAVLAGLLEAVRAGQRGTLVVRRALVSSRSDARGGPVHRSGRRMRTRSARLVRPQVARGDGPRERDRVGARGRGALASAAERRRARRAPLPRRIGRLSRTRVLVELGRAHLLYGEWPRRERRRIDACEPLRTAHEMFVGFAGRASSPSSTSGRATRSIRR